MLLMMDKSKAFDSIHRAFILEDFRSILVPEELHMIKLMIDDVKLAVKTGNEMGNPFNTNILHHRKTASVQYCLHCI